MSEQLQRIVVLDTETTGMNKDGGASYLGHNIIEIGAVEVINRRLTGRTFHVYIKPPRLIDEEASAVHGITDEMVKDKPSFAEIADEFIEFIKGAELVIHNAPFDVGFMDYEFSFLKKAVPKTEEMCVVTDSLKLARQMYPGKRNNLDALCERLGIDNSKRVLHGALLDAEILADVYLTMTGGQLTLWSDEKNGGVNGAGQSTLADYAQREIISGLAQIPLNEEEIKAHQAYLELLDKKSKGNCMWLKRNEIDTVH